MGGIVGFVASAAVYAALVVLVAYGRWRITIKDGVPLRASMTFQEYLPRFPKEEIIPLGVCTLLFIWGSYFAAVPLAIWEYWLARPRNKENQLRWQEVAAKSNAAWLAHLGATRPARKEAIDQMFSDRRASISAAFFSRWHVALNIYDFVYFEVTRNLASMDNKEREYLRAVELLNSAAEGKNEAYGAWRATLLWAGGKGVLGPTAWYSAADQANPAQKVSPGAKVGQTLEGFGLSVDKVITMLLHEIETLRSQGILPPELDETKDRVFVGGSAGWLKPADVPNTVFKSESEHVLRIGSFADGTPLTYSGEGCMVTIAPPGSGKTQCNVFPNLLTWNGPCVVLDISGDIYEKTSKWRAENVGPVYKFSPLEPEGSHCYNPLSFVRNEPRFVWEDSRLLAETMIVPSGSSDPFWENEARTVLTAAIAYVCYSKPPENRPMNDVLNVMYGGEPFKNMIEGLRMAVDVAVMQQHANSISDMNEKTLSSVLQTARSSLSAWTGERIAQVTRKSDWSPLDLRGGKNPTIYIYMRPNEVDSYLSLLRVFIGQHIRMLTAGAVPPRGSPPVLFMLDELPRLRYMAPVDEALNIGRKYGLRLWMFAQSVGQLQNAYENADGMMGSCVVRIFMNPSGADGQAEKLSEQLGYIDSVADANRKRLAEATELAGPAFKDLQIVLGLGAKPAKVTKDFAWRDATLNARMGSYEVPVAAQ